MDKKRFRSLSPEMETEITALARQGVGSRRITRHLELRYDKAPSRGTVDNFLHWWRNQLQQHPELDAGQEPWSLGALADPARSNGQSWADAALILRVLRRGHQVLEEYIVAFPDQRELASGEPLLTLDMARWIARLGRIVPNADPLELYAVAAYYAGHERLARARGQPFDTCDLDEGIDPDSERPFRELATRIARPLLEWVLPRLGEEKV